MPERKSGGIRETLKTLVYAVAIALAVRTFLFEPFNIPSGSMKPTLLVGDYLFVSKFAYGYSRYSLPLGLPLFSGRIMERLPERGDVVVFKLPSDNKTDYIKRVVGLPGDRIQVRDGLLYINDVPVPGHPGRASSTRTIDGRAVPVPMLSEQLPERPRAPDPRPDQHRQPRQYRRLRGAARITSSPWATTATTRWTAGSTMSASSRCENLIGRAELLFFSVNGEAKLLAALDLALGHPLRAPVQRHPLAPACRSAARRSDGRRPHRGELEALLGYRFRDPRRLEEALTHGSVLRHPRPAAGGAPTSGWSSWATGCSAWSWRTCWSSASPTTRKAR